MLKPLIRLLAATLAFFLIGTGGAAAMDAATVNGETITLQELTYAMQTLPEYQKLQQEVLKRVIINTLYYQESVKAGTQVDDALVSQNYQQLMDSVTTNKAEFDKLLKTRGTTEEELKASIKKQLMVKTFMQSRDMKANITITDEEAKLFYDEQPGLFNSPEKVRVSHIHIAVAPDANDADVKKGLLKIQAIEKELKAGKPFAEIAKARSNANDAKKGGDVGFITRTSPVAKSLLDAAFSLKKGERSGIIKSLDGFHIIEVTDRKEASTLQFDEVKGSIKNNMTRERLKGHRSSFEQSMADKAEIKILLK